MSVAVDLLHIVDQVLATPDCWIKGVMRRDKNGKRPMLDRDAVAWCLGGALCSAMDRIPRTGEDVDTANKMLHDAVSEVSGGKYKHFVNFNDDPATTFDDIKRVIQIAISYEIQSPDGGTGRRA